MESLHRLFILDKLFHSRRYPIPTKTLQEELGCSLSTLKRLLNVLRDQYHYPITYSRQYGGYFYDHSRAVQVSGLWFSALELQAILILQGMLEQLQPGLLKDYLDPLLSHVKNRLKNKENNQRMDCIKLIPLGHQYIPDAVFLPLCQSVINQTKVRVDYYDIASKYSSRELSPQRLVCYRHNWYLDAWCHLREGLRTFWVPGIASVESLAAKGQVVDEQWLSEQLESSYGIFDGNPREVAHLRFTGQAARRLHKAQWHPMQKQQVNEDGSLEMWVPYSNYQELLMDILRYGAQAQIIAPESLKKAMQDEIARMLKLNQ